MFIATLAVPFLIAPAICMGEDNVGKSEMIGTLLVASGVITLFQNILGCR
jgi:nucleobase transporter 1/2